MIGRGKIKNKNKIITVIVIDGSFPQLLERCGLLCLRDNSSKENEGRKLPPSSSSVVSIANYKATRLYTGTCEEGRRERERRAEKKTMRCGTTTAKKKRGKGSPFSLYREWVLRC